jgi:hypothetical protein
MLKMFFSLKIRERGRGKKQSGYDRHPTGVRPKKRKIRGSKRIVAPAIENHV